MAVTELVRFAGPAVMVVLDAVLFWRLLRRSGPASPGCTYPQCACATPCRGRDEKGPR